MGRKETHTYLTSLSHAMHFYKGAQIPPLADIRALTEVISPHTRLLALGHIAVPTQVFTRGAGYGREGRGVRSEIKAVV